MPYKMNKRDALIKSKRSIPAQVQPVVMPVIVCLCGSTRFKDEFVKANLRETLNGKIVLSIGCDMRTDSEIFGMTSPDQDTWTEEQKDIKQRFDELHKRKIDLADEILVLNIGGYIGKSTRSEIEYAEAHGKMVRYLET